ncbi:MAG: site-2 protease family protein [Acidobacteriota bacterium]|nr:site-2 protease family protein [Acidobacteriota bacterium]
MRFKPFQVARLFGIPLMIDYSWLPMAALHVWLVAQFWLPMKASPPLPLWQNLLFGAGITALFFASVLGHELAHAFVARLEGIKIYDIQLHIFGGWARLVGEPSTAMAEFRVAVAGPAASFLLAIFFWLCLYTVQEFTSKTQIERALAAGFLYLAAANLFLAMFNLLPGLPLDGGRAMRAYLWHKRGDILSATRTMSRMGVGIAYMLMSYGIFLVGYGMIRGTFWQDFVVAVWMMVLGAFLKNAAESDYRNRQRLAAESTSNGQRELVIAPGTVGEVMIAPAVSIAPELRVSEFVDNVLPKNRLVMFAVAHEGRLHGILSLVKLRELPSELWEQTIIRDVMLPISEDLFVPVRASIEHAQRKLKSNQLGFLAVIDQDGFLVGSLNLSDLEHAA